MEDGTVAVLSGEMPSVIESAAFIAEHSTSVKVSESGIKSTAQLVRSLNGWLVERAGERVNVNVAHESLNTSCTKHVAQAVCVSANGASMPCILRRTSAISTLLLGNVEQH